MDAIAVELNAGLCTCSRCWRPSGPGHPGSASQGPRLHRGSMNTSSLPTMPASRLLLEFERMLDVSYGLQTIKGNAQAPLNEWSPTADIHETEDALTFTVELPGIAPDQVQVTAEENVLTIRATRSPRDAGKIDARFHLIERHDGAFLRRFQLPPNVDASMITAEYANGLLELRVPKAALPQATISGAWWSLRGSAGEESVLPSLGRDWNGSGPGLRSLARASSNQVSTGEEEAGRRRDPG